jgi:hypothetical protein
VKELAENPATKLNWTLPWKKPEENLPAGRLVFKNIRTVELNSNPMTR